MSFRDASGYIYIFFFINTDFLIIFNLSSILSHTNLSLFFLFSGIAYYQHFKANGVCHNSSDTGIVFVQLHGYTGT